MVIFLIIPLLTLLLMPSFLSERHSRFKFLLDVRSMIALAFVTCTLSVFYSGTNLLLPSLVFVFVQFILMNADEIKRYLPITIVFFILPILKTPLLYQSYFTLLSLVFINIRNEKIKFVLILLISAINILSSSLLIELLTEFNSIVFFILFLIGLSCKNKINIGFVLCLLIGLMSFDEVSQVEISLYSSFLCLSFLFLKNKCPQIKLVFLAVLLTFSMKHKIELYSFFVILTTLYFILNISQLLFTSLSKIEFLEGTKVSLDYKNIGLIVVSLLSLCGFAYTPNQWITHLLSENVMFMGLLLLSITLLVYINIWSRTKDFVCAEVKSRDIFIVVLLYMTFLISAHTQQTSFSYLSLLLSGVFLVFSFLTIKKEAVARSLEKVRFMFFSIEKLEKDKEETFKIENKNIKKSYDLIVFQVGHTEVSILFIIYIFMVIFFFLWGAK